jgi:origin recognition complex subunit 6
MSFPPHIYSGLSSILPLIPTLLATAKGNKKAHPYEEFFSPILANDPESKDKTYRGRITTLIVALYFVVLSRADDNKSDRRDADDFVEFSRIALEGEGLEGQEYHDEVNTWLANIVKRGFMEEQEWFKNVPPSTGGEASQNARNRADEDEEDIMTAKKRRMMNGRSTNASRELEAGGLLPGLGTMMSDRLDWLSDERKADFLDWKAGIMERIRIIEGV